MPDGKWGKIKNWQYLIADWLSKESGDIQNQSFQLAPLGDQIWSWFWIFLKDTEVVTIFSIDSESHCVLLFSFSPSLSLCLFLFRQGSRMASQYDPAIFIPVGNDLAQCLQGEVFYFQVAGELDRIMLPQVIWIHAVGSSLKGQWPRFQFWILIWIHYLATNSGCFKSRPFMCLTWLDKDRNTQCWNTGRQKYFLFCLFSTASK